MHYCSACKGTGWHSCPRCGGDGRFESGEVCYYCNGKGEVECHACDGSGIIKDRDD